MENKTMKIDDEITFWVPYPNMPPSQKGKVVNVKDSYMTVISKTDGKEWTINIRHGLYSHQSNN